MEEIGATSLSTAGAGNRPRQHCTALVENIQDCALQAAAQDFDDCTVYVPRYPHSRDLSPELRTPDPVLLTVRVRWCMQERREMPMCEQEDPVVQLPAAAVHDAGVRGGSGDHRG